MFSFFLGTLVGGTFAILMMCLFLINRNEREDDDQ